MPLIYRTITILTFAAISSLLSLSLLEHGPKLKLKVLKLYTNHRIWLHLSILMTQMANYNYSPGHPPNSAADSPPSPPEGEILNATHTDAFHAGHKGIAFTSLTQVTIKIKSHDQSGLCQITLNSFPISQRGGTSLVKVNVKLEICNGQKTST